MDYKIVIALIIIFAHVSNGQRTRKQVSQSSQNIKKLVLPPDIDVCGRNILDFDTKIINGKPAVLGAYPWMANIGFSSRRSTGVSWGCAGSLITDQYILTAAHCVEPTSLRARGLTVSKIRLGELNLNPSVNDGATPVEFDIEDIKYHPQYDNSRKVNDIALIKLKGTVKFTRLIRPICLPSEEFATDLFVGYSPVVAGWGKSILEGTRAKGGGEELLEAEVEIQDTNACRTNITSTRELKNAVVDDRVICAGSPGTDSCQGDSGGPLMFFKKIDKAPQKSQGNMFLIGVVSYGYKCAIPGYPGVYTRVTKYLSWIFQTINL